MIICERCGNKYPGYYIINTSSETDGYQQLCYQCFNKIMADKLGIKVILFHNLSKFLDKIIHRLIFNVKNKLC